MPKPPRTKPVSGAQVRAYAGKAEEYADAAASEVDQGRFIAATSLAVHAAINAADAVCGARLGVRAAGEDHDQVLTLLRQAGVDGAKIETDLRRDLDHSVERSSAFLRARLLIAGRRVTRLLWPGDVRPILVVVRRAH